MLIPPLRPWLRQAPDLPGYGFTEISAERKFVYSFDALSKTVEAFVDALGIDKLSLYLFDFGAPCGIRCVSRTRVARIHPRPADFAQTDRATRARDL